VNDTPLWVRILLAVMYGTILLTALSVAYLLAT